MTEVFELRVFKSRVRDGIVHSVWDSEENAYEAGKLFGFRSFTVQPRRVMGDLDIAHMMV